MFLFDPSVTADLEACQAELNRLMERIGGRLIVATKWDERRLAYEVRGRKRGIYVLTFFEVDATKIPDLERDARLSESVLRFLLLQANHLNEEQMKEIAAKPCTASMADAERIGGRWGGGGGGGGYHREGESRGGDRGDRGDRDRDRGGDRDRGERVERSVAPAAVEEAAEE
jgi:small subunit ribosomal protein S6